MTSISSYTCDVDQTTFIMPSDDSHLPGGVIAFKPNGKVFKICDDCLDYLWAERNPAYQSRDTRGLVEIPDPRPSGEILHSEPEAEENVTSGIL